MDRRPSLGLRHSFGGYLPTMVTTKPKLSRSSGPGLLFPLVLFFYIFNFYLLLHLYLFFAVESSPTIMIYE